MIMACHSDAISILLSFITNFGKRLLLISETFEIHSTLYCITACIKQLHSKNIALPTHWKVLKCTIIPLFLQLKIASWGCKYVVTILLCRTTKNISWNFNWNSFITDTKKKRQLSHNVLDGGNNWWWGNDKLTDTL